MEQDLEYRQRLLQEYKEDLIPLLVYLPWLESNRGQKGSTYYQGVDSTEHSLAFPVYEPTLMDFVKKASKSRLMDRNYKYVYTRNRISSHADERRRIAAAELRDWDLLRGILSKYVLGGRTKGILWSEGVQEDIFYLVLKRMREIIEYWDAPLRI